MAMLQNFKKYNKYNDLYIQLYTYIYTHLFFGVVYIPPAAYAAKMLPEVLTRRRANKPFVRTWLGFFLPGNLKGKYWENPLETEVFSCENRL